MSSQLTLGQKIKNFRKRAGLSQLQLETELEASAGYISRVEVGKINPTKEMLINIAKILDINAQQTADLFQINIFDQIGSIVNSTLQLMNSNNADQVLQDAVNIITRELSLLGSVLFLKSGNRIYAKTLTQTWYTRLAFEIIGIPFSNLNVDLVASKSHLVARTILEQKPFHSNLQSDFTVPPLSKKVSDLLQKLTGTKSLLTLPIITDGKAIGALLVSKNYADDFSMEMPVLQAFASSIATALRKTEKVL